MKFYFQFLTVLFLMVGSIGASNEQPPVIPDLCADLASDAYYDSLRYGETYQEAVEAYHDLYTICCFEIGCEGLVEI